VSGMGLRGATAAAATAMVAALLVGCTAGGAAPTPSANESATAPPTQTESLEPTTPGPTTPGAEPTPAPLTIFLVLIGDDGASGEPIGCGDSLVPVTTEPIATDDRLRASIVRLFEAPEGEVIDRPYYTAVPGGTLDYVDGRLESDGTVTVELTGTPLLGGECDDPRIVAQLERTAMFATGASEAEILIDGVPIEEFLRLD
jgi:hypothetical protein